MLFALIVTAAACSAKAAEAPRPTEPPVSHFQGTCESDPDGTKFAAKVCYTDYYPGEAGSGSAYHPPSCSEKPELTDRQKEVLAKAYRRAPEYMRAKLCLLTRLFVTATTTGEPWGWGFWEGPDRPPGKGVYIAITDRDLNDARSVADIENQTTAELIGPSDAGRRSGLLRLGGGGAPADPEVTVLAEMAHELGHVLLSDTNADGTDPRHPRREVSGPPRSACFESAFLGASWDADSFHKHMRRWAGFGEQNQNRQTNPEVDFSLSRLMSAARRGRLAPANEAISNVFRSREFVSFAAAVAPEEDFVETYKYKVLADAAPKLTIGIRLRGHDINVLGLLDSGVLAKKVSCLRELGMLSGMP
jgi:hypothetical protein